MEDNAFDFNLNRSAEIVCSKTGFSLSKSRRLLKAGIYFGLGDIDDIEQIIVEKELAKI